MKKKQCKDCGYYHSILGICLVGMWSTRNPIAAKVHSTWCCHEFLSVPKIAKILDKK